MHLGLEVKRSKCEMRHSDDTRNIFTAQNIVLPDTSWSTVIFLGSQISAGQHLDLILATKEEELQWLTRRLELMPSHDSLFKLLNVMAASRVVYLLHTAPCCDSPELLLDAAVLRDSLSTKLNVDLDDNSWTQTSLPAWASVVLHQHRPPTWLQLQVPWSSHPPYFHCIYKQQRTAASPQHVRLEMTGIEF